MTIVSFLTGVPLGSVYLEKYQLLVRTILYAAYDICNISYATDDMEYVTCSI